MASRFCGRWCRWIGCVVAVGVLLQTYAFTRVTLSFNFSSSGSASVLSKAWFLSNADTVNTSLSFPTWERPRQFLDKVAAFKITNEDPLAVKYSVLLPRSTSQATTELNPDDRMSIRPENRGGALPSDQFPEHRKTLFVINHPDWNWIRMGNISLNDCPVDCSLTSDPAKLQTSDAVIVYAVGLPHFSFPPRPEGQIWIFFSLESPVYSVSNIFDNPAWHGQINWTMTYRRDSDIWYPYGRVNRRMDPLVTNYTSLAERKTQKVAWFVSHCSTQSRREDYANILKKHIKIDIFGMCGSESCGPEGSYECLQMLTKKYKFYLSFENALCDGYVTEKLFRKIMVADVVPIVLGHVNYTTYLPPKSFIDVADFDSVASLGNYLNYLDKNVTAYTEYLEWKRYYFVVEKPNPTCEVCMKLTEPEKYRKVYGDIFTWWTKGRCHSPKPVV